MWAEIFSKPWLSAFEAVLKAGPKEGLILDYQQSKTAGQAGGTRLGVLLQLVGPCTPISSLAGSESSSYRTCCSLFSPFSTVFSAFTAVPYCFALKGAKFILKFRPQCSSLRL